MPKIKYKQMIKRKTTYFAILYLIEKKDRRNGKGKEIIYTGLEMQNYLKTEDMDITKNERKFMFQLRTRMCYKIKSHFRNMNEDCICEGCGRVESNTKHILECEKLIGKNGLVTYIPSYEDLFGQMWLVLWALCGDGGGGGAGSALFVQAEGAAGGRVGGGACWGREKVLV